MDKWPIKLATKLLFNGMRFRTLKWTGRAGKVQALSIEITHRCIARCIMCNIWKIPKYVEDLPVDSWLELLSDSVFSDLRELDVTGGEPFLVKDLDILFSGICALKGKSLRKLKSIAVTTNGFLTESIFETVEKILPLLKEKRIDLVVVCAMDAIGDIHEKIRNYEDAWPKVNKTVEMLIELRKEFPSLIIGLKTTVLPINVGELESIIDYAESRNLFTIISPCIITRGRYLNVDRATDLAFSHDNIEEMISFYESDMFKWSFHAITVAKYLKRGVIKKPCSCGFNYFFVRSSGEVYPCPLIPLCLGNVREKSIKDIISSKEASQFRRKVGRFEECRQCTEPGLERYSLPYEGLTYLSLMFRMGLNEFKQLHRHMGLEKYFD